MCKRNASKSSVYVRTSQNGRGQGYARIYATLPLGSECGVLASSFFLRILPKISSMITMIAVLTQVIFSEKPFS